MPKKDFKIIPKPKQELSVIFSILFWISLFLLFVGLAVFFLLNNQVSVLAEQDNSLRNQIIEFEQTKLNELKKEIIQKSRKADDVAGLFGERQIISNIFNLVRLVCHPQSQFSNFNFNIKDRQVTLGLTTENFRTLGEQTLILKVNPVIKDLNLASIHLTKEGVVELAVAFSIDEAFFNPETSQ